MLTDYTIASDTRFKAAISGAGTGNQLATYGTRRVHAAGTTPSSVRPGATRRRG